MHGTGKLQIVLRPLLNSIDACGYGDRVDAGAEGVLSGNGSVEHG